MGITDEQYKEAARKAYAQGDVKTARSLLNRIGAMVAGSPAAPQENVVATTKDGGRVVMGAGGKLSFVSPAYSTNDPEKVAKIMEGATPAETSMSGFDQSTIAQHPIAARAAKAVQGVPFVGEYADEVIGAVSPDAGRAVRATNSAMDRQNPIQSTALQVLGGVVGSIPAAIAAAPTIGAAAPASLGARVAIGGAAGAAAGATEGAVSGYGRGTGDGRKESAVDGGIAGAAFGGLVGAAAPAVGAGLRAVFERLKGRDVSVIAKTLGVSDDAARAVKSAIQHDDLAAAQAAITKAGPDAMIADAGPGGARMLDTATKSSGAAARVARDAIEPRVSAAKTKMDAVFDSVLGAYDGIKANAKGIASRTSTIRKAAYDRAYSMPVDYSTGAPGEAVLGVLERIPPKTISAAISEANDAMRAAGIKNMQIMAEIADDGSVAFREMPNVQQLDEIKKALGSIAAKEVDQFGRPTSAGIRAQKLAGSLRDAIADAVGPYKTAVRLGGDKIAEDNALALGKDLLTGRVSREAVGEFIAGKPSRESLQAAKSGLRSYIDDAMANVRRTIADPSTDAGEAMKMIKDLSSRANREKVTAVLGQAGADRIYKVIDEAAAAMNLRGAISRNSDTFGRQAMSEAIKDIVEVGPVGYLKQGKPFKAAERLAQILTGATKEADQARMQQVYAEIAKALTGIRGGAAANALKVIDGALQGQPIKTEDAKRIANLIASSAALAGYQTGTRSLPTQQNAR